MSQRSYALADAVVDALRVLTNEQTMIRFALVEILRFV